MRRSRIRGCGGCIPRDVIFAALWVALYGGRAVASWVGYGASLEPDTWLYVDSEHWWYPSPLGRLFGVGGYPALALLNVLGACGIAAGMYRLSRKWGGSPHLALGIFFLSPAAFYVQQAGVDAAAAALVVWSVALGRDSLAWAAAFLHPASVLGWVAWRVSQKSVSAILTLSALAVPAALALLLSPYGAIFAQLSGVGVLYAVLTAAIGYSVIAAARALGLKSLGGGAVGGLVYVAGALEAGAQGHIQVRYLLPGTALLCARLRR